MTELLSTVAILFIAAGPLVLVANRFDLPVVPSLILAGLLVGWRVDEQLVLELAGWGIALLVFVFAVQVRPDAVRVVLRDSEQVAIGQILLVGAGSVAVGVVAGLPIDQAAYVGLAAALSSTIVGTALLQGDIERNLVRGRLAESVHFVQDLVAVLAVLVVSVRPFALETVAVQVGYGLSLLAAGALVHWLVFDTIVRVAGDSDEQLIISIIAILVVFLGAAQYAGVSIVVGAFAAGVAVPCETKTQFSVFDGLASIRDFFVAVFFLTIGALVTVPTTATLALGAALALVTAVVTPAVTAVLLASRGYGWRSAVLTGLSLDQVSEFTLAIAIEALILGLIAPAVFEAIILAAAATMIISAVTRTYDEEIYRWLASRLPLESGDQTTAPRGSVPESLADHVVVVGYGRKGRQLVERCERLAVPYVVIENDPLRLEALEHTCMAYVFADATDPRAWEAAAVEDARVVVSTVDSPPVSEAVVAQAGQTDAMLHTADATYARELLERGAVYVSVDHVLATQQLVEYLDAVETGTVTNESLRADHRVALEERVDRR